MWERNVALASVKAANWTEGGAMAGLQIPFGGRARAGKGGSLSAGQLPLRTFALREEASACLK